MLSGRKVDFSVFLYAQEFATELIFLYVWARRLKEMPS